MAEEQNKKNNDTTKATGTSGMVGGDKAASTQDAFASTSSPGTDAFSSTSQTGQGTGGGQNTQSGGGTAEKLASTVGSVLRGDTGAATGAAKGIVSQVKETGGKAASQAIDTVKQKATTKIEDQKATLAQGLGSVADTIRQVGENLRGTAGESEVASTAAKYGDSLATQVEQFSNYLDKHNVSDLLREVERFARRNPAYFIGGAFALGLLGARFLKSSSPNQALMEYQGENRGTGTEEVFHHHTERDAEGSGEGIRLE
jgi:hypothetical protein